MTFTDRHTRLAWLAMILVVLSLPACTVASRPPADPFSGGSVGEARPSSGSDRESRTVSVHVRNVNFSDATVYLSEPGRRRLGRVTSSQTRTFQVSTVGLTTVRFRAELSGGTNCTTWYVEANPGEDIDLLIDSAVRPRPPNRTMSLCYAERRRGRTPALAPTPQNRP
jgi:hypothetical protein